MCFLVQALWFLSERPLEWTLGILDTWNWNFLDTWNWDTWNLGIWYFQASGTKINVNLELCHLVFSHLEFIFIF